MDKGVVRVKKGIDERIDEGVLWWFSRVERMENDKIAKRVYVEECDGSSSIGMPQKRWIDIWFGCQANKENGAG